MIIYWHAQLDEDFDKLEKDDKVIICVVRKSKVVREVLRSDLVF